MNSYITELNSIISKHNFEAKVSEADLSLLRENSENHLTWRAVICILLQDELEVEATTFNLPHFYTGKKNNLHLFSEYVYVMNALRNSDPNTTSHESNLLYFWSNVMSTSERLLAHKDDIQTQSTVVVPGVEVVPELETEQDVWSHILGVANPDAGLIRTAKSAINILLEVDQDLDSQDYITFADDLHSTSLESLFTLDQNQKKVILELTIHSFNVDVDGEFVKFLLSRLSDALLAYGKKTIGDFLTDGYASYKPISSDKDTDKQINIDSLPKNAPLREKNESIETYAQRMLPFIDFVVKKLQVNAQAARVAFSRNWNTLLPDSQVTLITREQGHSFDEWKHLFDPYTGSKNEVPRFAQKELISIYIFFYYQSRVWQGKENRKNKETFIADLRSAVEAILLSNLLT